MAFEWRFKFLCIGKVLCNGLDSFLRPYIEHIVFIKELSASVFVPLDWKYTTMAKPTLQIAC